MLDKVIHFSIKNKLIIALFTLALIIWGIWSATKLPIDAVPDITNNQVQIITNTPTLASQEVEQFVTYPIEQSLANLPDLEEIRSISRFGLSVITVVFHDDVNIYFARQLINEKLKQAESQIPHGVGTPELAPVSTGLGEVYQYVIYPKKGSEHKYNAMDLRTMQDWIVARQLYGTPGVAEVNSFGGVLKQYEVAVNPDRLKAINITVSDIFTALEKNNQNTGGAYIDKKPNAYFIRGIGLVSSLDDIRNIIVKNEDGVPILIKDVAKVQFGSAIRYGAMTRNGENEVVGGIVMMLKGSNSAEVVSLVKEKMETVKRSLPADIEVEAFLDRTDLVDRAISTVEKNLIEGALIVILVLVVFLGNLRAGLIVASAIPLSMLFALGMMNVFGVSANLMSLGAIDFGLIVDGAVIIVEATMHHLGLRKLSNRLTQHEMDAEVYSSASKIRKSAAFGEIIILIVYIPILTLVGIEGKMFRPMAQTVGFAILGALILSLTYIPMMCARFLPKQLSEKKNISDRIMEYFQRKYEPVIQWAIRVKYYVVTAAVALLVLSIFLFTRLGGEFIPQLQEGDYAFHCILPQGSSLSQSVETSMQVSRILKQFPEVKQVIGKTGSAEVPTDPMPPEASDIMIILKDKDEWTTTDDYNELARMMEEKLEAIPGVFFEANQPIQMRFNELMTGIRQDVAIKIFGGNIDDLAKLAPEIAKVIQSVSGTTSPQIERTTGLPQITIQYDRSRMANYGLNIEDVNSVVSAGFAGEAAGVVFENERKFDLVVRLDSAYRTSIEDVNNLFIPTSNGSQIPLKQIATISFKEGPAQISREDAKRRIVIGFNVKGRDVQSVVKEIREKLDEQVKLPTGYYYTFGGTFENLEKASKRLSLAVPIALLLIFSLLYFTFNSLKQAALIFTAIPMAAIGGVFALLMRGMPFSISAGVGFIALFGVAVLNGIVLIGTFNQLEKEGMSDVVARVLEGTKIRLRPVLMTATVASLGFLPMAISTGAGAEVQKPLATVVIGGLITATFLTLVVLPLLYILFAGKKSKVLKPIASVMIALLITVNFSASAQDNPTTKRISLLNAIDTALKNNLQVQVNELQIQKSKAQVKTSFDLAKTGFFVENEDMNPSDKDGLLKIGLSQELSWPGVYTARKDVFNERLKFSEFNKNKTITELKRNIRSTYYSIWYLQDKRFLYNRLDSIYTELYNAVALKVKTGESAGLDQIAVDAKLKELKVQIQQIEKDIQLQQQDFKRFLNTADDLLPELKPLNKVIVDYSDQFQSDKHPIIQLQQQNVNIATAEVKVQKRTLLPDLSGRFYSQRLYGYDNNPYSGYSVSIGIPLAFGSFKNKIKAAQIESYAQEKQLIADRQLLITGFNQAVKQLERNNSMLSFYETTGLKQAQEIIKAATTSYRLGEISFTELSQYLTQAIDIQKNYLENLNQYNQSAIQFNYIINN
ncbi:CusA/CzcA family heavy metal efflux RND transporter [Solitalea longa]|uniref:CusA/CzcA family heavy metal efflux RND transporter n=1 Tax=Solitalea longa TaxID=2079460 RepID=A0A2S5A2T8_9SPHI|nr:CusA/CzcA family heavy metal efflux RND transporter [Solitalea longa]POY36423.1 CusA/CzcA family heavy metal efflux RND transporter [Solitalea longa]